MTNEINTKLSNYYKKELCLNDIRVFHEQSESMLVGLRSLLIIIEIEFGTCHLVCGTLVSSKSMQSKPKLLGLRLN